MKIRFDPIDPFVLNDLHKASQPTFASLTSGSDNLINQKRDIQDSFSSSGVVLRSLQTRIITLRAEFGNIQNSFLFDFQSGTSCSVSEPFRFKELPD